MSKEDAPVISVILPITDADHKLVNSCILNFLSQDYPRKELVIVNNSSSQFKASALEIPARKNVIIFDTPVPCTVGMAMNYGISVAGGQIIARADVRQYYAKNKLSKQALALIQNDAQICLINNLVTYNTETNYAIKSANDDYNSVMHVRHSKIDYDDCVKYEDVQYISKLVNAGCKAVSINGSLLACTIYGSEVMKGKIKYFGGSSEIVEDHYKFIKSGVRNRIKNTLSV